MSKRLTLKHVSVIAGLLPVIVGGLVTVVLVYRKVTAATLGQGRSRAEAVQETAAGLGAII